LKKNLRAAYREEMEGILELIVQMAFADLQQANFNRTREKMRGHLLEGQKTCEPS